MNLTPAMMKNQIKTVHGHTLSELEDFLKDSCDVIDGPVSLETTSLGGWSNINIHGRSSGTEFVLKLPWSTQLFDRNPYNQVYDLSLYLSRLDIAAPPLEVGRLPNSQETPFYLVEYIKGTTHSSIEDASEEELLSLKASHHALVKETPRKLIPKFETPLHYLNTIRNLVENHNWLSKASGETRNLLDQYELLLPKLFSLTETIGPWAREAMHGDLWIPNIVFRPNRKALLLDFEACAIGDPNYDLAYLLEAHDNKSIEKIPVLFENVDTDFIYSLRPLVLACVIDWSIARLLSMESGIVEPNLNTEKIRSMILGYAQGKIDRFRFLLR